MEKVEKLFTCIVCGREDFRVVGDNPVDLRCRICRIEDPAEREKELARWKAYEAKGVRLQELRGEIHRLSAECKKLMVELNDPEAENYTPEEYKISLLACQLWTVTTEDDNDDYTYAAALAVALRCSIETMLIVPAPAPPEMMEDFIRETDMINRLEPLWRLIKGAGLDDEARLQWDIDPPPLRRA